MGNILLVDPSNASSHLMRAILKGRGHGVSISSSFEEARRKVETGLFDTVFLDAPGRDRDAERFIDYVADLLPGFPVVLVGSDSPYRHKFFSQVDRPLRLRSILNAASHAISHIMSLKERRKFLRKSVHVTVEVTSNSETLPCKAVNMSPGGIEIVSWSDEITHIIAFDNFFQRKSQRSLSTVLFVAEKPLEVQTAVAYCERNPLEIINSVGLVFSDLSEELEKAVQDYLVKAA